MQHTDLSIAAGIRRTNLRIAAGIRRTNLRIAAGIRRTNLRIAAGMRRARLQIAAGMRAHSSKSRPAFSQRGFAITVACSGMSGMVIAVRLAAVLVTSSCPRCYLLEYPQGCG